MRNSEWFFCVFSGGLGHCEGVSRAHQFAAAIESSLPSSASTGDAGKLSGLPNVMENYLKPQLGPKMVKVKGSIGLHKAAILTFQTWSLRVKSSAIQGLILATAEKAGYNSTRCIVATSISDIWRDKRLEEFCQKTNSVPVGIVLPGDATEDGSQSVFEIRDQWCQKLIGKAKEFVLVVVSRHHFRCLSGILSFAKFHEFSGFHWGFVDLAILILHAFIYT